MMIKDVKNMSVCLIQCQQPKEMFQLEGKGDIQRILQEEKKTSKECYQATRVCLKSEGVNLNLATS